MIVAAVWPRSAHMGERGMPNVCVRTLRSDCGEHAELAVIQARVTVFDRSSGDEILPATWLNV